MKFGRSAPCGVNCTFRYSYVEKYSSDPSLRRSDGCARAAARTRRGRTWP